VNCLVDTHLLLWYLTGDSRVSKQHLVVLQDANNTIHVSNASLWEIVIKVSIGKLKLNVSLPQLKDYLMDKGFNLRFCNSTLMTSKRFCIFHSIIRILSTG